ncbi:hypothetical protein BDZ94DRAFT_1306347 [Collybia nuda]|uniref:B-related factor 1 n=1 Tax=Collybia nuda TaxID=64659 RepID=A0A9P5YEU3_9AGAR|nr:hypothetical protein BDZ94DRAFT_1306347 [Collybia nuda]
MAVRCSDCGGTATQWDDHAASAICTSCGTLADPSQSVLSSHTEQEQPYNPSLPSAGLWNPAAPTILKSFRTGSNWNLTGQATKEARDRKNSFAIAGFINSLAHSLNAFGLSPRATNIHAQAMEAGRFRWGRKAKLVAGACLAIALREYKRPDSLHDIAFLLDEPFPALVRTLTAVTSTLKLPCTVSDASVHIPSLQAHLSFTLANANHKLPSSLVAQLQPISFRAAVNASTALCTLLSRLGLNYRVNSLPGPPTSCALFLLGLESEARSPLTNITDLAACLAIRCHTSRSVVMERYKLIQDEVSLMIDKVPWLSKYKPKMGRAKIAKRAVVARGLADVIQFQNEIWSKTAKPAVVLEVSDGEDEGEDEGGPSKRSLSPSRPLSSLDPTVAHSPKKRQKLKHNSLYDAAAFLIDPLSAPLPPTLPTHPSKPHPPPFSNTSLTAAPSPFGDIPSTSIMSTESIPPAATPYLPLTSYILALPSGAILSNSQLPTRLQLLLTSRGGREDEIADEELFGDGEMEGFFRSDDEVRVLRSQFGWREGEDTDEDERGDGRTKDIADVAQLVEGTKKRNGEKNGERGQTKKSRINLQALATFLEDPTDEKDDAEYGYNGSLLGLEAIEPEEEGRDEEDPDGNIFVNHFDPPRTPLLRKFSDTVDGEVVIDEWHPLSPEVGRGYRTNAATDYEEEYD